MPYRIPAINEAAIEDAREIAAFGERFQRQRKIVLRRVVATSAFAIAALLVASVWMTTGPARFTLTGPTPSCTDDTCLCWLEEHHTWARFECGSEPQRTCFRSYGTCSGYLR